MNEMSEQTPPDTEPGLPAALEAELSAWLSEAGVEGRRLVRASPDEILVSKFEPGFAQELHRLLELVPELFDEETVVTGYQEVAGELPSDTPRVDAWHAAMHEALRRAGARLSLADDRLAEVRTGIDSVRVVLEACLWSQPRVGDDYAPRTGEIAAYRDGLAALQDGRDVFTRYYGELAGVPVRNHCPGAAFARRMLAQGWRACTGTPPPASHRSTQG